MNIRVCLVLLLLVSAQFLVARGGGDAFAGGLAGGMFGGLVGGSIANSASNHSKSSESVHSTAYDALDKLRYELHGRIDELKRELREIKEQTGSGVSQSILRRLAALEENINTLDSNELMQGITQQINALHKRIATVEQSAKAGNKDVGVSSSASAVGSSDTAN